MRSRRNHRGEAVTEGLTHLPLEGKTWMSSICTSPGFLNSWIKDHWSFTVPANNGSCSISVRVSSLNLFLGCFFNICWPICFPWELLMENLTYLHRKPLACANPGDSVHGLYSMTVCDLKDLLVILHMMTVLWRAFLIGNLESIDLFIRPM